MKRVFKFVFLVSVVVLCFSQCAKRGYPTGGPEDSIPPRFVRATPENYSTNFNAREIRIYFDEYIKVNNPQQQIIISPPMDPRPEITPLGTASKNIRIRINDTLQENTTYAINFGSSIVDNNANNPLPFFKYVFSTGNYIDSLSVSGVVRDAYQRIPENFVSVLLYEVDSAYTDSVVYRETPTYITNTLDSATTFELSNIKAGTYRLIALKDENNNYNFDPRREKIGFVEDFIQVPTDSTYVLNLFTEVPAFNVTRPSQVAQQHIYFGYEGVADHDSLSIALLSPPENFEQRIIRDPETDTLHYFYKPEISRDTLDFTIAHKNFRDSLSVRTRTLEKDSLSLNISPKGGFAFNDTLKIRGNTPINIADTSLFTILDKDSIPVSFTTNLLPYKNEIIFDFEKEENQDYQVRVLPGAITDFFGSTNDTITNRIQTRSYADYGNLSLNLMNMPDFPVIVQLTTENGKVRAERSGKNQNLFEFRNISPGSYLIRVIFDKNGNGKWDTGDFLEKKNPEKIVYFPELLDIRSNWDVSQTFILE